MPLTRDQKDWLNGSEAAEFLEVSFVTFQNLRQVYGLKGRHFPGQGRSWFFWKDHLQLIKDSSSDPETVTQLRLQFEREQTW
jgi:hypothetical protein